MESSVKHILQRSKSSFALGFLSLDSQQKRALTAIYGFCRVIDDIVDESDEVFRSQQELEDWKLFVSDLLSLEEQADDLRSELIWACKRFPIQSSDLLWLISACESDLYKSQYENMKELLSYCDGVASSVGFMLMSILGVPRVLSQEYVLSTARALQLTNIMRDVSEDLDRGRVYLPKALLQKYALQPLGKEDLHHPNFIPMMDELAAQVDQFYDKSDQEFPIHFVHRLLAAQTMKKTYRYVFQNLRRKKYPTGGDKVGLNCAQKGFVLTQALLKAYL
ncbi:MAG: squalene/phytoene synthase family protein [Bdellovibrionales bacterium]|nr:squalene/phytoene synthase family protein [Bdellovibrionales bacterium]